MAHDEHADGSEHAHPSVSVRAASPLVLGRYRVEGLIGRGGMATVHRAYDSARGHAVALKRLDFGGVFMSGATAALPTRTLGASVLAERRAQWISLFQREFRTLAQLAHPCIVEVYDYGVFDEQPYYTMELLAGSDLGRRGRLPWREVSSIVCDVASALTLLHARRFLHRDVSPRNVHCALDGRAKLLDFGAMSAMGPNDLLVGTPAFVAPEAVRRQSLDARCDLYALGALGYTLLTGAPPYVAQSFFDLQEAYRVPPPAISQLVPEVPRALEQLIMQLIEPDRAARPGSAVEVVERLRTLSGLEHDARLAVASAYLSAPPLVGRDAQLAAVRRRALRAQRRRGASLLVSGVSGSGRSRFLDACALEGKLVGALVLRCDPIAAAGGEFGAARALLLQLQAALSESERSAYPPPERVSEQLLPGLQWHVAAAEQPSALPPQPLTTGSAELARAVHDYWVQVASARPLMLLVDDFERIDVHSAGLFASLAEASSSCRLLLISSSAGAQPGPTETARQILEQHSRVLELPPLTAAETQALLRSVCGDVPNLRLLADRLHALSAGSPSMCIELTRHLIERRVIRYEAGGFMLPDTLSAADFPESLEQVLRARFAHLSGAARQLGAIIALCAGAPVRREDCLRLVHGHDAQAAFDALASAELLLIRAEYVSLRQSVFGAALLAGFDAAQRKLLHAGAAALLRADPALHVHAADHYFLADQPGEALDLLLPAAETDALMLEVYAGYDELLARALQACAELGRPSRHAFLLRRARARHRISFVEPGDCQELLDYARELEPLTGLTQSRGLNPSLTPLERLVEGLKLAQARYDVQPEHERLYAPLEALTEIATYTAALAGYAVATYDAELQERAISLEPFVPLSAAIGLTHRICVALRDLREGRHELYYSALDDLMLQLDRPDRAGLPDGAYERTRAGILYAAAMSDATLGRPSAFSRADELAAMPHSRALAWRVRYIAALYRGDPQRAAESRREVEWLTLQENSRGRYHDTYVETEYACYARSDDLLGLRRAMPGIERMGARFPGWVPHVWIARGELARLRGRFAEALACSDRALALARPGAHSGWAFAAALHVRALLGSERAADARAYGLQALEAMQQHKLIMICSTLRCAVAQAHSACGDPEAAIALVDLLIASLQSHRVSALYAGLWHEQRARLALQVGDTSGFWLHFNRTSEHYGAAVDSTFAQRLASLSGEERDRRVERVEARVRIESQAEALRTYTQRELAACEDGETRALRGLSRLLELTSAATGHLFGVRGDGLVLLASPGIDGAGEGLPALLWQALQRGELGSPDDTQRVDEQGTVFEPALAQLVDASGIRYRPLALTHAGGAIVGVAAISCETGALPEAVLDLLALLGAALFARGEVEAFDAAEQVTRRANIDG